MNLFGQANGCRRRIIASTGDRGVTSARTTGISKKNAGVRDVTSASRCDFKNTKLFYDTDHIVNGDCIDARAVLLVVGKLKNLFLSISIFT
jgi:hypothetical protein